VSPVPWRYRRKITMARGENNAIGFHPYDDPSSVFDLVDCLITEQAVMDMWTQVRAARRLLPADLKGITLCRGRDDQLHLLVNSVGEWEPQAFAEHVDSRVCVWVKTEGRALNQCSGPPTRVSPDSFEQANDGLAETIREFAVDRIGEGPGIAWDLYGGFGDTARGMAASGFKVWSVDTDAGVREWREPEDDPDITWVTGRVEQVMARLPEPNVVVVNPPRVGLAAAVTNLLDGFLERSVVSRVAYVSCDPATLARDLRRMPAGKIVDMRAYDLFPQTSHVETVVILAAQP
jgi:tRNA/tmRNA/rRNA uracil-C5-methylase (TrmA/RlmC/RlmD family)